jgi:predicted ATP-grasp superfamily ATP-dependent carboligase
MDKRVHLWETPHNKEMVMIVGWAQWADAGAISSGLPQYLIEQTDGRKIGEIDPDGFYLFQIPGTHHLLRPVVKLEQGQVQSMSRPQNEFYYADRGDVGLVIFLGDEPHMREDEYTEAILDAAQTLQVRRTVVLGGVYGALPYDKDRLVSCAYSLPHMQTELEEYALRFSDYEGGATIGTYLVHKAAERNLECLALYGLVPAYDFGQTSQGPQGIRIEHDFKAWHDLVRRLNYMLNLGIDVADLRRLSDGMLATMEEQLEDLAREAPQLQIHEFLRQINEDFEEQSFLPLEDLWSDELNDILGDLE